MFLYCEFFNQHGGQGGEWFAGCDENTGNPCFSPYVGDARYVRPDLVDMVMENIVERMGDIAKVWTTTMPKKVYDKEA